MTTITVQGHDVHLGRPRSAAVCMSAVAAWGHNEVAGAGACIGVAWLAGGSARAPKARPEHYKHDYVRYGMAVVDELDERGLGMAEIMQAGVDAMMHINEAVVPIESVEAALGNSEAPPPAAGG